MSAAQVARSGAALALIAVSFFLFRGTTNLVNAITVPLVLRLTLAEAPRRQLAATFFALLGLVIILFRTQLFFVLIYSGLFLTLSLSRGPLVLRWLAAFFAAWAGFGAAVVLTDWLFGTPLQAVTRSLGGGSFIGMTVVLAVQAGLVVSVVLPAAECLRRRL